MNDIYNSNPLFKLCGNTHKFGKKLGKILLNNEYPFIESGFNIMETDNFIYFYTDPIINSMLCHCEDIIDNILKYTNYCLFDKKTGYPLVYSSKPKYVNQESQKKYIDKFDIENISVKENHIGKYFSIFTFNKKVYFIMNHKIKELTYESHPILFNLIEFDIPNIDEHYFYNCILIDSRLNKIINIQSLTSKIILLEKIDKKTFIVNDDYNEKFNKITIDRKINITTNEELHFFLKELNLKNTNKLKYKGIVINNANNNQSYYMNTELYDYLINMYPNKLSLHAVHLYLYQKDKLNEFLSYLNDTYVKIVKRVNISLTTISHEILDIYHITRNRNNNYLTKLLPKSYKFVLDKLHDEYLKQKKIRNNKCSITIDIVYRKMKKLDINILIEIFRNRKIVDDIFKENIIRNSPMCNNTNNVIRDCIDTKLQTLLII
jgi:hypothetical protein